MTGYGSDRVRAEEELARLRVIWSAFLIAPLMYGALIWLLKPGSSVDPELERWIAVFLGVAAGIQLLVVFVLKQMIVGVTGDDYRKYCIVRWALVESIGVYGLVQHFLGADWLVPVAFVLLSFIMTITMAPSALEAADLQKNWR